MIKLYGLLLLLLISALCLIALPFIKNRHVVSKGFFGAIFFTIFFSLSVYILLGDKFALAQWLAYGEQHYQLLVQFDQLGGIDGMIAKVKARVKANPDDKQGQLILDKLYQMKARETK